jgi:outer membrane protein assembly factor BamB
MIRIVLSCLALFSTFALQAADWPQWRGHDRSGISKETGLLQEWPNDGPKLRWKRTDIGTGYSTPIVVGGKVYVQTTKGNDEFVLCLDDKTGKEVWTALIGTVGDNRGMKYNGTRSTPTVDGDRVYCLASGGELRCFTMDGKVKWRKDLLKDLGGTVGTEQMSWAYSESVLVDGDNVVCTPGGKEAALAAINKMSGEVIWKCVLPASEGAEYASVMPAESDGVKQYITFLRKGLVGVDAKTGKLLWQYSKIGDFGANIMTPVVYQNKVFACTSRGGGALLELKGTGEPKEVYYDKKISSSIGGVVLVDGHLYGGGQGMFCIEFATGKVKWTEEATGNIGICFADGRLYARMFSSGDVILVEPNLKEYVEKGRVKQPDRSKIAAWPHPIVANGGLYVRDQDTLVCWDVKK